MNPLFKLPLHGVFSMPFCGEDKPQEHELPIEITLDFNQLNVNKAWPAIWSMVDAGERYHSEVSLYKSSHNNSEDSESSKSIESNKENGNSNNNNNYYLQINCQGSGLFKIAKNSITIDWQAQGTGADHYFQTLAVALNLELNNVLCIHANALAYKDQAIALVAPSRTGKTTLTAALSQNGFALMTDDMVALHEIEQGYKIYPSWPVARMWPDALNNLQLNASEQHKKVHNKFEKRIVNLQQTKDFNYCNKAKKLQVIYLLNRLPINKSINKSTNENTSSSISSSIETNNENNTAICEIVPIATAQAIIVLIQNSILGSCYRALNLETARVKAFSKLLENVTFKQINYISGTEHLNEVGKLIKQDLNGQA